MTTMFKPYKVVVSVNQNGTIVERVFDTVKSAQAFRETCSNWLIKSWITLDYDRK